MVVSRSQIRPLLTAEQLRTRIRELGAQLTRDYAGLNPVMIGLLNGVYPFFADLTRTMDFDMDITFMRVSSYLAGTSSTGEVKILQDMDLSIQGRHVLVVEDIVDTGLTISKVCRLLADRGPLSLKVVSLLDKRSRRRVEVHVDYVGFPIEDHYVVGFGLDYDDKFRNLPYIGAIDPIP